MGSTDMPSSGRSEPSIRRAPIYKPTDDGLDSPFTLRLAVPSDDEPDESTPRYRSPEPAVLLDGLPPTLVESLRYLVSRFQLGDGVQLGARLGVVAALHGEGVTTISRSLAAVIANDCDVRVCWVDLSWSGQTESPPPVSKPEEPGICDVLQGEVELRDALQKTEDDRLTIFSVGNLGDTDRQVLARSPALEELFCDLEKEFQCVIVDMPPILSGSAGVGPLRFINSYLLVVRHGVTTTHQVRAAVDELRSLTSLGVVLNRFKSRVPRWLDQLLAH